MDSTCHGDTMLTNLNTHFQFSISNLWDGRWWTGVMGELDPDGCARYPVADLHTSHELVPAPKSAFTHANIIQQENQSWKELRATLCWLQYIQYAADLLPLTTTPAPTNAFSELLSPDLHQQLSPLTFPFLTSMEPCSRGKHRAAFSLTYSPLCLGGLPSNPILHVTTMSLNQYC